jgi:hypothetical protein
MYMLYPLLCLGAAAALAAAVEISVRRCNLEPVFAHTEQDNNGDSLSDSTPICVALWSYHMLFY